MKYLALFVCFLIPAINLLGQNEASPVITVRKGTSVIVDVKEITGNNAAAGILKNDIQLSGALTLGDAATSTISITGSSTGGSFNGQATDKSGGVVLHKTFTGETRKAIHQFTNELVQTLTGQPGIALSKISFVADRTGHKEIYTCDYDGANALQLTHDNGISVSPALSPDGRKLAYTGYQSGYADIYLIDLASGARNRIIKFPGTNSGAAISTLQGLLAKAHED
jgi:TolB protein